MATSRPQPALKASLKAAVAAVARALAHLPASGMLIGGIAVIARGVPRTTRDVDATVNADSGDVDSPLRTSSDCWPSTVLTWTSRAFGASSLNSPPHWTSLSEPPSSNGL